MHFHIVWLHQLDDNLKELWGKRDPLLNVCMSLLLQCVGAGIVVGDGLRIRNEENLDGLSVIWEAPSLPGRWVDTQQWVPGAVDTGQDPGLQLKPEQQ